MFICRFFTVTVAFLLAVSACAAAPPAPASPGMVPAETVAQVNGMTERVIDKLWAQTDHYWHEGDYNRIVGLLRVCVEADPAFLEAYSSGAWLLWSMGDTAAADRFLTLGVSRNPGRWDLHFDFGWHLYNTKRYQAALPHLQKATTFPKASSIAWKTLGHCYDRLGRIDEAVQAWRTVVRRFPGDTAGPTNLRRVETKQRTGATSRG